MTRRVEITIDDLNVLAKRGGADTQERDAVLRRVLGQCESTYRGSRCSYYVGHPLGSHAWQNIGVAHMSWSDAAADPVPEQGEGE